MPNKLKGYLLAFTGSACSGLFTIFFGAGGNTASPITSVCLLFIWALLFNSSFEAGLYLRKKYIGSGLNSPHDKNSASGNTAPLGKRLTGKVKETAGRRLALLCFSLIIAGTILGNYLYQLALHESSPVVVQTSNRFEIIFVVFAGWLVFKEQLSPRFWFGTAIVIAGFVIMKAELAEGFSQSSVQGIMLGILSGVCFGIFQTVSKYLIRWYSPLIINRVRLSFNILLMLFFPGVVAELLQTDFQTMAFTGLAAFSGPFISRLSYTYSIHYIDISQSVLFTAMSPFITGAVQWIFLGIPISVAEMIGITVICGGILLSVYRRPKLPGKKTAV